MPGTLAPARAHKAYPSLSFIQSFGDHKIGPTAMCTDLHGDIWVASEGQGILEYAHGGTNPIAMLDTNADVRDCAYDPNR